jgi:hypothetical protein
MNPVSRITLITGALVALLAFAITTDAQVTINKCQAGKKKCVSKKVACLLKCHAKAETTGTLDTTCLLKCRQKFDGNQLVPPNPAKGCIQKLQAKGGCSTPDETVAMEAKIDAFVNDVVCDFDPSEGTCPATPTPTPVQTSVTASPTATPTPPACAPGDVCNATTAGCPPGEFRDLCCSSTGSCDVLCGVCAQ